METVATEPNVDSVPKLVFRNGPMRGQVLALKKDRTSIGRDVRNDIAIHDDVISSFHASILHEQGRIYLEDTSSKNGTFLNGKRIERAELKDGDIFHLCQTGPEIQLSLGRPSLPGLMEVTTATFTRTRSLTQALRELLPRKPTSEACGMSLTGVRKILDYKLEEATRRSRLQVIWVSAIFVFLSTAALVGTVLIHEARSRGPAPAFVPGTSPSLLPASNSDLGVRLGVRLDPIYGSFFLAYRDTPLGEAEVTNSGKDSFSGGELVFRFEGAASGLLIEPYSVAVPELRSGGVARISIRPKLSTEALSSQTREVTATTIVSRCGAPIVALSRAVFVHGRNMFNWERPERIAVFIDPNDAGVRALVDRVWPLRPPANRDEFPPPRLVGALTLITALANLGLQYRTDSGNPISERIDSKAIDRVSYPGETILARSGDCDDLSVLCCSTLEAAGIPTAFAVGGGHVLLLLDTGISAENLAQTPLDAGTVVVWKDRVWMPIESTDLAHPGSNFATAWSAAWPRIQSLSTGEMQMIELKEAWRSFQPMNPPPGEARLEELARGLQSVVMGLNERVAVASQRIAELFLENLEHRVAEVSRSTAEGPLRAQAIGRIYAHSGLFSQAVQVLYKAIFGNDGASHSSLREGRMPPSEETSTLLADLAVCLSLGAHSQEDLDRAAAYGEQASGGFPEGSREKGELMLRVALMHRLRGDLLAERIWSSRAFQSDPGLGETYRRLTAAGGPVAGPIDGIRGFLRSALR